MTNYNSYRYYLGRHLGIIIIKGKKKAIFRHLEKGYVGNKSEGYKQVDFNDSDICLLRLLYNDKKE